MSNRQPWFKFYTVDWRGDAALRLCSAAARGVWIEMLALMHESDLYGHLLIAGAKPTDVELASAITVPLRVVMAAVQELEGRHVFDRNDDGVIVSRRMVRDAEKSVRDAAFGRRGGNPKLAAHYNAPGFVYAMRRSDGWIKVGISVNPVKRAAKIREREGEVVLLECAEVHDMGKEEARLHGLLAGVERSGEWFRLSADQLAALVAEFSVLKGSPLRGPVIAHAGAHDLASGFSGSDLSGSETQPGREPERGTPPLAVVHPGPFSLSRGQIAATVGGLVGAWNTLVATTRPFIAVPASVADHHDVHAALRRQPDIDWWAAVCGKVAASDFLSGRVALADGRTWVADFWWVLANAEKVHAGRYDNREALAPAAPLTKADHRRAKLAAASAEVLASYAAETEPVS